MQTHFTDSQRADPAIQIADAVLRKCVHCGFCTATCPTYRLTGDERESPRGRISLIQNLLENNETPSAITVANLDHCLSCLSCESTCPSGVSYRRLIDQGRELIEEKYRRPIFDRFLRGLLAWLLPKRAWFHRALIVGRWSKPLLNLGGKYSPQIAAFANLIPNKIDNTSNAITPGLYPAEGTEIKRVALVIGCVQSVVAPDIDAAAVRVLTRHGCAVFVPEPSAAGCCGALPHHLGKSTSARKMAELNLATWQPLLANNHQGKPLDAILMTASGCGSMLKDYHHLLKENDNAESLSKLTEDLSSILKDIFEAKKPALIDTFGERSIVAWQNPCSLQHGLKEKTTPVSVLQTCGFTVREPRDAYLCCGSAGTYNLLQPEFAQQLKTDKLDKLEETEASVIVSSNIGCITQLTPDKVDDGCLPVVHLAQIIDWATGGPRPSAMK